MQADMNWFAVLAHHATRTPEAPMTVFGGDTITYGEMADRVAGLAGGLRAGGVGPGDVVGLLSYNCPEFLETLFAANYLGAIAMPINWRLAAPEVRYILEHSEARALVCDESLVVVGRRRHHGPGGHAAAGLHPPRPAQPGRRRRNGPDRLGRTGRAARRGRAGGPRGRGRRRHPPVDVHVGHHRPTQGGHAHPRQPGLEEPGPHRRVRLHPRRPRAGLRAALPRGCARPHHHLAHRRRRPDHHPPDLRRGRGGRRAGAIDGSPPCGWHRRWSTPSWPCPTSTSATCRRCGSSSTAARRCPSR